MANGKKLVDNYLEVKGETDTGNSPPKTEEPWWWDIQIPNTFKPFTPPTSTPGPTGEFMGSNEQTIAKKSS